MRRLLSLAIPCLLALPALAGCGADDVNPDALAQAADKTTKQSSVHIEGTGTGMAQGVKIPMTFDGDADFATKRVRMAFEGEAQGQEFSGEQVLDGTTMYMRMDVFEQAFGTDWVKMDLEEIGKEAGIDFAALMQMGGSQNPADQLAWLRAAADLEKVGEEELDGVKTTHYRAVVDLRRVADTAPAGQRESLRETVDSLVKLTGMTEAPTEVWIGEDDLVRRQKMTMKQTKPQPTTTTMDMRFTDYGKPVDIEPPSGKVKDLTEIAKQGAAEQAP
jgi:hypothetical protein